MTNLKWLFFCAFGMLSGILSAQNKLTPQRDILDVFHDLITDSTKTSRPKTSNRKVAFSLIPMFNDNANKTGIVISANSTFYLGDPKTTKMSSVSFIPYISFLKQIVLPIRSYLYTKNNVYNFTGDYRFMSYPQKTYGLAENNTTVPQSILTYKQWRFYQFITRAIAGNLRMGGGVQMDSYYNISEEDKSVPITDFERYMNGSYASHRSFGLTLQALFDSRINTINPQQGYYGEVDFRVNSSLIGSQSKWSSIYVDLRKYNSFSKKSQKVLATRIFYWSILGGRPHYLDLPSIGWDTYERTGRGFTRNRFRSNALLYFETEYRTDLTKDGLLGAVFFSNISSVSQLNTQHFRKWHPAIGAGLRIKWNKEDNSNLAFDFGKSKNDWSIRLGVTETF